VSPGLGRAKYARNVEQIQLGRADLISVTRTLVNKMSDGLPELSEEYYFGDGVPKDLT
jgi:hypothetical protein